MPYYILHKKIFDEICNKDLDLYNEFMDTIRQEYNNIMQNIFQASECKSLRYYVHRLISNIAIMEDIYHEHKYICSLILSIHKDETDFSKYKPYIEMFVNCISLPI
jgi:hypothetical protein